MKIRTTRDFMVIGARGYHRGSVVTHAEVPESRLRQLVADGHAVHHVEALAPAPEIRTAEPEPEAEADQLGDDQAEADQLGDDQADDQAEARPTRKGRKAKAGDE